VGKLVLKFRASTAHALVPLLVDEVLQDHVSADAAVNGRELALARAVEAGLVIGKHKARLVIDDRLPLLDELVRRLDGLQRTLPHANHKAAARRLLSETRAFRASAVDKLARLAG
jgi:hypothetical protein